MAWAKNGTPDTASTTVSQLDITDLTAQKFNQFLTHVLNTGGTINTVFRLNADSSSVYADRSSGNGGADSTGTSKAYWDWHFNTSADDYFTIAYVCSISGEEKLGIGFTIQNNGNGATNAPDRDERVGKYVPSPDADVTQVRNYETGSGSYDTGSNLTALTGDETETVTLQDGTIFEETDTNKAYIWNSSTKTWTQL